MPCCGRATCHTASGAKRFFLETARKAKQLGYVAEMRFDAGFAKGAILDFLTEEKIAFLARLKANARLQDLAAPHLNPYYSPRGWALRFSGRQREFGDATFRRGQNPPFPQPLRAAVGGEVRIGRFSFTDDPREEGMSRGWHEWPVNRPTWCGKTFRQSPLLQTSHQPLPQRNHGRG